MSNANAESLERSELLERLVKVTIDILNTDDVNPNVPLSEIGIDSLNIVEIIISCEEIYADFDIEPSKLEFDEMTSLRDMHDQMVAFEMAD